MRLSIRDLFWLILLVAGFTSWAIEHRRADKEYASALQVLGAAKTFDWPDRKPSLDRCARYADRELERDLAFCIERGLRGVSYEPCLLEMARRKMSDSLQRQHDVHDSATGANLELLTALRRAKDEADPLRIQAEASPPQPGEYRPLVQVRMTNLDVDRTSIALSATNPANWRFELTDESGKTVRDSNAQQATCMAIQGFSTAPVQFGDCTWNEFDLRSFVAPPRSGRYQLRVYYHNKTEIAYKTELTGHVVAQSEPVAVDVANPEDSVAHQVSLVITPCGTLAIACLLMAAAGRARRIAWCDCLCFFVVAATSVGVWIDQGQQARKLAQMKPDWTAIWTISAAP